MTIEKPIALAILTFLSGCVTTVSPLCDDATAINLDEFQGYWISSRDGGRHQVSVASGNSRHSYLVTCSSGDLSRSYTVHGIRIGRSVYVDAIAGDQNEGIDTIVVRHIAKIELDGDGLKIALLDRRKVAGVIASMPVAKRPRTIERLKGAKLVLTSSAEELQTFLRMHGPDVFGSDLLLRRRAVKPRE